MLSVESAIGVPLETQVMLAAVACVAVVVWFGWRHRVRTLRREFDRLIVERTRRDRELHDTALQNLAAVALEFDHIAEHLGPSGEPLKSQVIDMRGKVEQAVREARLSLSNSGPHRLGRDDMESN
jgi:signal transduction histidine kinase